jgi:hypothetical protein
MPLIGTLQVDGLAPIGAFRISSPSQLECGWETVRGLGAFKRSTGRDSAERTHPWVSSHDVS